MVELIIFAVDGNGVIELEKQVTLYTSWAGEEKFYNGETFTAYTETVRGHTREFTVSEKYVMQKVNNVRVIDTGSDAEFL